MIGARCAGCPEHLVFVGALDLGSAALTVSDSERDIYLQLAMPASPVPVRVWMSDHVDPDQIAIELG